jgi:hypothetical protein
MQLLTSVNGINYFITANEGDAKNMVIMLDGRLVKLTLDPLAFPDAATLQSEAKMGDLYIRRC